jgi:hypothetical protein
MAGWMMAESILAESRRVDNTPDDDSPPPHGDADEPLSAEHNHGEC